MARITLQRISFLEYRTTEILLRANGAQTSSVSRILFLFSGAFRFDTFFEFLNVLGLSYPRVSFADLRTSSREKNSYGERLRVRTVGKEAIYSVETIGSADARFSSRSWNVSSADLSAALTPCFTAQQTFRRMRHSQANSAKAPGRKQELQQRTSLPRVSGIKELRGS